MAAQPVTVTVTGTAGQVATPCSSSASPPVTYSTPTPRSGLLSGFPVVSHRGPYEIVHGLEINKSSRKRVEHSVAKLLAERDLVIKAGLVQAY